MPLKPKTCPCCGDALPWDLDTTYLAEFALYLSGSPRRLYSGKDTHLFYADPRKWFHESCVGDMETIRAEYEAERTVAA